MTRILKAPFPYFGGKSNVAKNVWARFGAVPNYVEPFAGSLAVLLGRPNPAGTETVNDKEGMISNFWRALAADPEAVAHYADWPLNENDLHARHSWLVAQRQELQQRLEGDPDFYDPKIAGWWVWGMSLWIGGEFCSGKGPWMSVDGKLVNQGAALGVKRAHLHNGLGVERRIPHLHDGRGVKRKATSDLLAYFSELAARLRNVQVCSGDWSRVCGPTVTTLRGITAVFLDPPYSAPRATLYTADDLSVSIAVRDWAISHQDNPNMRIALCGYEGEHEMPPEWDVVSWKTQGGYSRLGDGSNKNREKERIWFSPACKRTQLPLDFA